MGVIINGKELSYGEFQELANQAHQGNMGPLGTLLGKDLSALGRPAYPEYRGAVPLGQEFQLTQSPEVGKRWLERALSQGPSEWANLMGKRAQMQSEDLRAGAARETSSALAKAQDALAMTGGLDRGQAARLAMQSQDLGAQKSQGISAGLQRGLLDIGLADENTKLDLQKELMGNQRWNISQSLNEGARQNAFNLGRYGEQMKGWAAGKTADAQASSGKK